ncbi:leucyl/phenylalanyl-tRNA--protein transferase [Poseidonocella pacifica]|uniref:Leucyl/phenylalanyl-tRNA--protein transferase n=1 Tax=Poseidonocella pacifica TaxID=871651 RepID=A0A1I0VFQ0_9RHOB|nr:leucyl/phenylalanyl-tRNA--protein transferase [Poseidonocella pacifica]SFA75184.1 leucyl/phenylalanyl-tRNA--protein transferase [Poseidonocella pacifica]
MSVLTPELLLRAYRCGIFPMAEHRDDPEIFWVDPKRRGILPLDGFHISRSLARFLRTTDLSVSLNRDFRGVVEGCADREETWINEQIFGHYLTLHELGHAHSLEVRGNDGALLGGVYGVSLGGGFFGESMFSRVTNASKMALAYLTTHLDNCGYTLFDTQFITPHLASLGGQEIPRAQYLIKLEEALEQDADIHQHPLPSVDQVLQRRTQRSKRG